MPAPAPNALLVGTQAAFHGRPRDGIAPLHSYLAGTVDPGAEQTLHAQWLLGVCQGAAGSYGTATTILEPLLALPTTTRASRHWAGEGAAALASFARQLGSFDQARQLDSWALQVGQGDSVVTFTATLGLAADAVGHYDRDLARDLVAQASSQCWAQAQWWRERVRLGWVQAEVALSWDRPQEALVALAVSLAEAERHRAWRHVAKTLGFTAVAQRGVGDPTAPATLERAARLAESLDAWPLVWASRGLLADWLAADPQQAQHNHSAAARAVRIIGADLPPGVWARWSTRADVAGLLGLSPPG